MSTGRPRNWPSFVQDFETEAKAGEYLRRTIFAGLPKDLQDRAVQTALECPEAYGCRITPTEESAEVDADLPF